jgi:hypothetical protein
MQRGRSPGARDVNGWRIPREDTIARMIYDMTTIEKLDKWIISDRIGRSVNYVGVALWKMQNADKANGHSKEKQRY